MRVRQVVPLLFLLYLALDFADAQLPGVFSFESNNLFVDSIIGNHGTGELSEKPIARPPADLRIFAIDVVHVQFRRVTSTASDHAPVISAPRQFLPTPAYQHVPSASLADDH